MEITHESMTRRTFLAATAPGLVAGMTASAGNAAEAQQTIPKVLPPKIELPRISAPSERDGGSPPKGLPPHQRVGFALVGLGHLTLEQILPAFAQSQRCKPTALVSGDPDKARRIAEQYGLSPQSIYDYKTYDRLRDNPDVTAVYIVLPNSMHAEYTVRAAGAGKHVLCEKPMATSVREAEEMIAACKKANRKLMIAYRIQYEPFNRMVKEMVRSKSIGAVKQIDLVNVQNQGDPNHWRLKKALAGGGSLPDIGLYCLNTARYLTGEEPIELSASLYSTPGDPRFREVEEGVTWQMRFPSGTLVTSATNYGAHDSKRYRVYGSEAWVDMDPAFSYRGLRLHLTRKSELNPKADDAREIRMDEKNQFALELDHFAECLAEDRQPYTPGEEGLQDHKLMAAIYESARTGRTLKFPTLTGLDAFRGAAPTAE